MSEPSVRLSESAMAYVELKAQEAGLSSVDEVVEAIIQRAIRREPDRERVEKALMEGLESGPSAPIDWEEMRRVSKNRLATRVREE